MVIECGRRFLCPDCRDTWTRCILAKGHIGRCSWRLDTPEEIQHRTSWVALGRTTMTDDDAAGSATPENRTGFLMVEDDVREAAAGSATAIRYDHDPRFADLRAVMGRVLIDRGLGHVPDDAITWNLAFQAMKHLDSIDALPAAGSATPTECCDDCCDRDHAHDVAPNVHGHGPVAGSAIPTEPVFVFEGTFDALAASRGWWDHSEYRWVIYAYPAAAGSATPTEKRIELVVYGWWHRTERCNHFGYHRGDECGTDDDGWFPLYAAAGSATPTLGEAEREADVIRDTGA
jgi:hypothetical protein